MRKTLLAIACCIAASVCAQAQDYGKYYTGLPVELAQVSAPSIPDNSVCITDFGGVGDGIALNTEAFADAVSKLAEMGGGHLTVPAGIWLTGPIRMKSHIDLHLDRGAMIILTPDKKQFINPKKPGGRMLSGISASKCTDISITGEGVIDGNGKYWRYVKRSKVSDAEWKAFMEMGGETNADGSLWFPFNLKHVDNVTSSAEKEESLRAHLILFNNCSNVLIQGVTIQNSPRFHISPAKCSNVIIDGVTVRCPWNAQNGDGIDLGNCDRALVTGCTVDVGDDAICMKGGAGANGLKAGPCKDILIQGNTVLHGHGGFVIGSDCSGGMERIVVRDCTFSGTDNGLRFKSTPGRGGSCKDIHISGIVMNDIREAAVVFSCDYVNVTYKADDNGGSAGAFYPDFTDIHITGVTCRECATGIKASGLQGHRCVHGISVSNSTFFYTEKDKDIDTGTAEITESGVRYATF